jgi:hypothetical protein
MQVRIWSRISQGINVFEKPEKLCLYRKIVWLSFNLPDARIFSWSVKMVHLFKLIIIFIIIYELWHK